MFLGSKLESKTSNSTIYSGHGRCFHKRGLQFLKRGSTVLGAKIYGSYNYGGPPYATDL